MTNVALAIVTSLAVWSVASASALAQDITSSWRVSITPYLWISDYEGDIVHRATGRKIRTSAGFGDIISGLKFAAIGTGEVQYKRAGVIGDLIYLKHDADQTLERPLLGPTRREGDVTTTTATVAGFYRVVETSGLNFDVLAGIRYAELKVDVSFQGAGLGFEREGSQSFTVPVVGARATQRIGAKSSLTAYGDLGAFSDDKTVWQLYGTYNYQWTRKLMVSAGYRHFVIDLERARTDVDITLTGPLAALTYTF